MCGVGAGGQVGGRTEDAGPADVTAEGLSAGVEPSRDWGCPSPNHWPKEEALQVHGTPRACAAVGWCVWPWLLTHPDLRSGLGGKPMPLASEDKVSWWKGSSSLVRDHLGIPHSPWTFRRPLETTGHICPLTTSAESPVCKDGLRAPVPPMRAQTRSHPRRVPPTFSPPQGEPELPRHLRAPGPASTGCFSIKR